MNKEVMAVAQSLCKRKDGRIMNQKNKSFKRCGDCIHIPVCAFWNYEADKNTDATNCSNYQNCVDFAIKAIDITSADFGTLAICAIRYCHGRMTYMPEMVRDIIRPNLGRISDKDLNIMLEDCDFQRQTEMYGDEKIDKPGWIEWENQLKAERERRNNAKQ